MINWNSEPYNDDFDEQKKFLKVLFRPGKAVQTRELNQIQSILQNQISCQGDHLFKQGAMVIPGQASIDKEISYVKLRDVNADGNSVNSVVERLIGLTLVGENTGIMAEIIFATKRTGNDPATLFVRYKNSGTTQQKVFNELETLFPEGDETSELTVDCASGLDTFGKGCIASVKAGIYYVNGFFTLVQDQTIVLDKYSNAPSYRVGLKISEVIVKPEDDESLLDNSQNTQNFAAPGAHRYQVNLILEKRALDSQDDKDFIELVRTEQGISTKEIRSTEYSILEQTFARRTYDESGDYVVKDFNIDIREDRNNDRGAWKAAAYLFGDVVTNADRNYVCKTTGTSSVAPTHTTGSSTLSDGIIWKVEERPYYNRGVYQNGSPDKLCIGIEPGKAYVQGYEIEKIATEYVKLDKARTFKSVNNATIPASIGNYVFVKDVAGAPPLDTFATVTLKNSSGVDIGSCRIRYIEKHDGPVYKLFIFDVKIQSAYFSADVRRVTLESFSCNTLNSASSSDLGFKIFEPQKASLIFPFPYYAIKSVDATETSYYVTTKLTGTVTANICSISVAGQGVTFAPVEDTDNYLIVGNDGVIRQANLQLSSNGTLLTLNGFTPSVSSGSQITLVATIRKTGGRRSKTLATSSLSITNSTLAQSRDPILLGQADGYKLVSVKMSPGGFVTDPAPSYTVDITDRYVFNDGQAETHYGEASVSLRPSFAVPAGPIQITFEYFIHTPGDYFTIESYTGQVDYKEIPFYNNIPLRDCFDFRPKLTQVTPTAAYLMPKRGQDITVDFEYYVGRKSKLCLDNTGKFFAVDGEPSLSPGEPPQPKLSMVLYNFELEPYTFGTLENNISRERIDNRRYTMRDIGKLEKRIDNLEYYTTLSLLEQETHASPVIDSDGLDRFKNGFIVDSFSGHGVGDTQNPDYLCSIDMENGVLRPFFAMNNVNLIENVSTDAQRDSAGYKLYGDVITLPVVDHVTLVDQPYASRTENVNPFAIFTFLGDIKLNPSTDEWFETDRRPDIINNVEGNFNSLMALSESAGVLGTVWNSWQNMWTGSPKQLSTRQQSTTLQEGGQSLGSFNSMFGSGVDLRPAQFAGSVQTGRRTVTLETVARDVGQSRSGVRTSIITKVDRETVEDRTVSSTIIPFIRSRNVLVQVKGLKANTVFYPFFDDVDVSIYCTPTTWIEYSLITSKDFDSTTNAGSRAAESARQINDDSQVCLNVGDVVTNAAGTVTGVVVGKHTHSGKKYLHVANIKGGTFQTGRISAVNSISGADATIVSVVPQTALKTSPTGDINFIFKIPNTNSLRFRTGTREFKLIDSATNSNEFTSRGTALYQAKGVIETKQATINSVRNAEIVRETVSDTRTIVQTSERPIGDTGWYDPLAQTFLVQNKGGAFISKVDIFFAEKDENVPVTMEIREVVNGYPGKRVLPFSRVTLASSDVKLSSNYVRVDGVNTRKYDTPTSFVFPSPVYVNDSQEYCVVLLSDSNKYKVWISQIGDAIPDSDRTISEQPYAGVLFKSQNASTWTADQYQDLKFKIYRAKFDISKNSEITFVNDVVPGQLLEKDPLEFKAGTKIVRVFQKDHGFKQGDKVTLTGISGTTLNGILVASIINKEYTIPANATSVQLDSYIIELDTTANATTSGYFGGDTVRVNRNYAYSAVQPIVASQTLPGTGVLFNIKNTKYSDGLMEQNFVPVLANENNTFYDNAKVIKSGSLPSCYLTCKLYSENDSVSPVIDTHRTSLVVVSNKANNPTVDNCNYPNFTPFYVSDTEATDSSTYSNYVTRRIRLLNPSTFVKVKLAANIPASSDVEVYYRATPVGSTGDINLLSWTKMGSESAIVKVENGNDTFFDISYIQEINTFDSIQIKIAMKTTNTAAVPRIKDLRVIACA